MSWCLGFDDPGKDVLLVHGITHVAFMNSELKILMGFNDPKCHIEFQLGRFQITPLQNWCVLLISWAIIYTQDTKIFQFKKKEINLQIL